MRHLTRCLYHGPVTNSFNEVRLRPLSDATQTCTRFELRLTPEATVREYEDFHKNRVHYFDLPAPHTQLDIEAISLVETQPERRPLPLTPFAPSLLDDPAFGFEHFRRGVRDTRSGAGRCPHVAAHACQSKVADLHLSLIHI